MILIFYKHRFVILLNKRVSVLGTLLIIKTYKKIIYGGGWMYRYAFIYLSAGTVEWESSCFATTIASCTSKGDISASGICHLWRLF